jgi:sterol desaturase/sphingolipid hydroxylase (fatty acid hydroxylase superfamily)
MLWLVILAVIFVPLERWVALTPSQRTRNGTFRDLAFYFFNSLLVAIFVSLIAAPLVLASQRILPDWYTDRLDDLPLWATMAAAFVVGEIGFYWGHRWSHEWPLLWQFHVVHHRPRHLDWLINTRAHPVDMVFGRLCGLTPIYLLGLAGRHANDNAPAAMFIIVGTIWSFLIHANIRWAPRWLEPLLATPRFHHWHHVKGDPIDRNYASMLPVMDRLFGTLHMPEGKAWPKDYGVKDAGEARPNGQPRS